MPYINKNLRSFIGDDLNKLLDCIEHDAENSVNNTNVGNLNYIITSICLSACKEHISYASYNSIIGVLECVKLEFYRRLVSKYEDSKIKMNGDINGFIEK